LLFLGIIGIVAFIITKIWRKSIESFALLFFATGFLIAVPGFIGRPTATGTFCVQPNPNINGDLFRRFSDGTARLVERRSPSCPPIVPGGGGELPIISGATIDQIRCIDGSPVVVDAAGVTIGLPDPADGYFCINGQPSQGGGVAFLPPLQAKGDGGSTSSEMVTREDGEVQVNTSLKLNFQLANPDPVNVVYREAAQIPADGFAVLEAFNIMGVYQGANPVQEPATVQFTYDDAALANASEANLSLYYFDTSANLWMPVPSTVDTINNVVVADVSNLSGASLYAFMAPLAAVSASSASNLFTYWLVITPILIAIGVLGWFLLRSRRFASQRHRSS